MAETDFFDDDLVKRSAPEAAPRVDLHASRELDIEGALASGAAAGKVGDVNLARMAKHRDQLENQVATTYQQIEKLRQKQEGLEVERRSLEDLRRKQDEYVKAKRDMVQKLNQGLIALEKEEVRATQMVDLYGNTRNSFKGMLAEIQAIDETGWEEEKLVEELDRSVDLVQAVRVETRKALAKLDALGGGAAEGPFSDDTQLRAAGNAASFTPPGFVYWLKTGAAMGIPLALLLGGVGFLVYFAATRWMP